MKLELAGHGEKRRAALTLHALHVEDRDWVLTQLGGPQRAELESLLAELAALGIPRDVDLVSAALVAQTPGPAPKPVPPVSLQAESKALAKLLAAEPDAIALHCLPLLGETQRAEVTGLLTGDKRVRIKNGLVPPAPALTGVIAKLVAVRLAVHASSELRT